jgi:hypothetical protein
MVRPGAHPLRERASEVPGRSCGLRELDPAVETGGKLGIAILVVFERNPFGLEGLWPVLID